MPPFTTLRYYTPALLALLLLGSAHAAVVSTTDPPAKRQPVALGTSVAATKSKIKAPAQATTVAKTVAAPESAPAASEVASATLAPQPVQLKGIVLAPDGRPCAGASVYPAGAPRQLVVTDAQGTFTLPVPAGTGVSLRVDYFGEGSSRVEVPVPGTEPLRIVLGK